MCSVWESPARFFFRAELCGPAARKYNKKTNNCQGEYKALSLAQEAPLSLVESYMIHNWELKVMLFFLESSVIIFILKSKIYIYIFFFLPKWKDLWSPGMNVDQS